MPDYTQLALQRLAQPIQEDEAKKEETLRRQAALEAIAKPAMSGFGQATGAERLAATQGSQQRAAAAGQTAAGIGQQMAAQQTQRAANLAGIERGVQQQAFAEGMQPREQAVATRKEALAEQQQTMGMKEKEAEMQQLNQQAELKWQELAMNKDARVKDQALAIRQLAQETDQFNRQREIARYQFDQGIIDAEHYARLEDQFKQEQARLQGAWMEQQTYQDAMTDINNATIGANAQMQIAGYYNTEAKKAAKSGLFGALGTIAGAAVGTVIAPGAGTVIGAKIGQGAGGIAGA